MIGERRGHILVAEDHPVNQRVAVAMLEHIGYDVDVVGDGAEAVKAAHTTRYEFILMDCQLPVLNGFAAAIAIRNAEREAVRIPIIAISGSVMNVDRERCIAAGMDDYLTKPLSLDALSAVVARWAPGAVDRDRPVLDTDVIDRLVCLGESAGEDLLGPLVVLFLADAEARIVAMRDAVDADDPAAVVREAHTLSGSSANVGATDLAHLCAILESEGAARALDGVSARIDNIRVELERVRNAFDSGILAQ